MSMTITTLQMQIAHTITSVNAFFEALNSQPKTKFNNLAFDFQNTFTSKYAISDDICDYFPIDKTIDNISNEDYSAVSNLLDALFATKEAIIGNASFLALHNSIDEAVQAELNELKSNTMNLQKELDLVVETFNGIDLSNFYDDENQLIA
jgi:hypothetical protein